MSKPALSGFEIHEIIGVGAGSKIYRATRVKSGKEVAIKHVTQDVIKQRLAETGEYKPHRNNAPIDYNSFYSQLKVEYDILQRLAKTAIRSLVPEVYSLSAVRQYLVRTVGYNLVMEYVPGPTLREKRDYPVPLIAKFYVDAARILYALHGIGLLHSDLKPQHFVILPAQQLKLLDFGQVRKARETENRRQGTPDYMAPEQLKGGYVDERTDVYCLGASFYWILTGKSNRPAMAMAGGGLGLTVGYSGRARSIREENPEVPEGLEKLVLDSCEPKPEKRPASMREVVERLEAFCRSVQGGGG